MEEGGGFAGNQQGYFGQQQSNQGAGAYFGGDQHSYAGMAGGMQQQQQSMGGGQMDLFGGGGPQHSTGLQEHDSAGPFATDMMDMQFNTTGSLKGPPPMMMVGQQSHQQQQPPQQQQQSFAPGQSGDQSQADQWQQAFFKLAAAAGVPVDANQGQPPEAIIEQAQAARHRDPWIQAQARDAAMQVQAAVLTAQNIHLRRELGSGWAAADPNIIQVQQLILDPAIEHEFQQLRAQLALRVAETEAAKAAYEGQSFSQESKNGHALLRKVKVLTDENEDLGRATREGKAAAQAAIAAVERRHADELREEVQELRDLCNLYQQENEELNMVTVLHQRQLDQIKQQMVAQPAPVPHRDYGRDRGPPGGGRDRDVRVFDRLGDGRDSRDSRDRAPPPSARDGRAAAADRDRDHSGGAGGSGGAVGADRPRYRTAERSRDRDGDRAPREREREYDMSSRGSGRGGGYGGGGGRYEGGGRGGGGGRFSSRGRGRNIAQQYSGQKRSQR